MSRYIRDNKDDIERYNYAVLLKLLVGFSTITLIPIALYTIMVEIYSLPWVESPIQFIILVLGIVIFSFSTAIYYTSITIEQFVFSSIKDLKEYKPLRIAIKFFHGPVSHVGQYLGINLILITFSFFSYFKVESISINSVALPILSGSLLGLGAGYAQHYNRTWRYQLWAYIIVFVMYLLLIVFSKVLVSNEFTLFNLIYFSLSIVILFIKNLKASRKGERNIYAEEFWWI